MNDNNLNLNNDLTENDFFLRIDNLTKDLSSNELLMLSDYISQKAKSPILLPIILMGLQYCMDHKLEIQDL